MAYSPLSLTATNAIISRLMQAYSVQAYSPLCCELVSVYLLVSGAGLLAPRLPRRRRPSPRTPRRRGRRLHRRRGWAAPVAGTGASPGGCEPSTLRAKHLNPHGCGPCGAGPALGGQGAAAAANDVRSRLACLGAAACMRGGQVGSLGSVELCKTLMDRCSV